jgi:hypothetical protein
VKLTVGQLKRLINEQLAVNVTRDPFPSPEDGTTPAPRSRPVTLKEMGIVVSNAERKLGSIPQMLGSMEDQAQDPKAKDSLKKAGGLAYHALNDLKALKAILMIAVKQARQN